LIDKICADGATKTMSADKREYQAIDMAFDGLLAGYAPIEGLAQRHPVILSAVKPRQDIVPLWRWRRGAAQPLSPAQRAMDGQTHSSRASVLER
jgi:hypothetical protein